MIAFWIILVLLSDVLAIWFYTRYRRVHQDYYRQLALLMWFIETRARIEYTRKLNQ